MGTRHITTVYLDGELKVRQYGQWDGCPTGLGEDVLNFCASAYSMDRLAVSLASDWGIRWMTPEESAAVDALGDRVMSPTGDPDADARVQNAYWDLVYGESPCSRDCGAFVLYHIAHGSGCLALLDWGGDMASIEGTARIDIETVGDDRYRFGVAIGWHGSERVYDGADVTGMTPDAIHEEMQAFEDDAKEKEKGNGEWRWTE